jgi:hypothetical protein
MLVPISQGEDPAMTSVSVDQDYPRTSSPLGGSLAYLLMNLPLGIAGFVTLFTLLVTGLSTAVVWVGLTLLAFAVRLARGAARAERARVYALPGRVRPVAVSAAVEANRFRRHFYYAA